MNVLVEHIPHAIPVVAVWGLLLRYWLAQRRLERAGGGPPPSPPRAPTAAAGVKPAAAPVRRSVAVRGLLALGPLIGALATGLVIYALNLGRGRAGDAAIWTHVGLSLLALLLVAYKISEIGVARMRQSLRGGQAWRAAGALVLLALWVPLLASGVALLLAPSDASFTAYAHLIAGVWWTALFLWHLRRYLVRATRAVFRAQPAARPATVRSSGAPPVMALHGSRLPGRARVSATVRPIRASSPSGEQEASPTPAGDGAITAPSRGR